MTVREHHIYTYTRCTTYSLRGRDPTPKRKNYRENNKSLKSEGEKYGENKYVTMNRRIGAFNLHEDGSDKDTDNFDGGGALSIV